MKRPIIVAGALLLSYSVLFGCATTPQPRDMTLDSGEARTAYELSEVDRPPRVIGKVDPLYPAAAKSAKIQGKVTLRFIVTKDGRVDEATVVRAEPSGVFDDSALKAILSWRFRPAIKDGKPVNVIIIAPLKFELVDDNVAEKAQRPLSTNEMIGTWKLVYAKWGGIRDDTPKRFTVLMHQSASHSIHVWINPESKQVAEVFGGMIGPAWPTYGVGGVFERLRGHNPVLTQKIEGNRWYNTGRLADGMATEEVWERIAGEQEQAGHKLIGSWKLVRAKHDGRESDLPKLSTTLKLVTSSQTVSLREDPVSHRVETVVGGMNSLTNDVYIENADYGFGVDFERIRGERLSFTWKVEGDKWYNRSSDGRMIDEVWERVEDPIMGAGEEERMRQQMGQRRR